jgi:DNA helicase-2/ATP-dependent DNA helicase PcrA
MAETLPKSTGENEIPQPVAEEERLLALVMKTLEGHNTRREVTDYHAELVRLRDSLADERLAEDQASIVEQMDRTARLAAQQSSYQEGVVNLKSPYFGHMRLRQEDGEKRDVLIGRQTFIRGGVRIVDWRNAPISKVFYQNREGEDYEISIAGRNVEGEMEVRRTLTIDNSELLRVETEETVFVRSDDAWLSGNRHRPMLQGGSGTASRPASTKPILGMEGGVPTIGLGRRMRTDKHLPEIASLLDPEQFRRITQPDSEILAIQGTAGSGKTTVALHRVAYLAFANPDRFQPHRILIIVYSRALASYISKVLPALGVPGVQVLTFEKWARRLRRRHFSKLPMSVSNDTPPEVSRLKRHPALLAMLDDVIAQRPHDSALTIFEDVFTDRRWLRKGTETHAAGVFSDEDLKRIQRWCTKQHSRRIDEAELRAEGGGTPGPNDPRASLDDEDDAILLYLHQQIHGALQHKNDKRLGYNHIVVDEAQDLGALELKVLLGTGLPGAPVTLAGDTAQQVNDHGGFADWSDMLSLLGLDHVALSPLKVSYRSTRPIMELAHSVLGHLAPPEPSVTPRDGVPAELIQFPDKGAAFTFLADALRDLIDREPKASVAVLTRFPAQADETWTALDRADLMNLRRVRDQDFSFSPGIEVTDIRQAKGLEFDYVIVMDCDAASFPDTNAARHHLHVAITRAAHQVWLVACAPSSPLLPNSLTHPSETPAS